MQAAGCILGKLRCYPLASDGTQDVSHSFQQGIVIFNIIGEVLLITIPLIIIFFAPTLFSRS